MSNQRNCHRFVVAPDQAHITVVVEQTLSPAILSDMSASGFGLLIDCDVSIAAGQVITVATDDARYECQVAYCMRMPGERVQRVGLRRVKEYYELPIPIMGRRKSWFRSTATSASPLLFVGVLVGFAGFVISAMGGLERLSNSTKADRKVVTNLREVERPLAATARVASEVKQTASERIAPIAESVSAVADQVSSQKQQAAALLTGSGDFTWPTLVSSLGLSGSQQRQLLNLVETPKPTIGTTKRESPIQVRQRALAVLTHEQRGHMSHLVETGRF